MLINDLPIEIKNLVILRTRQLRDPQYNGKGGYINYVHGAFLWKNSIEGQVFWYNIDSKQDFSLFYELYPKSKYPDLYEENNNIIENYKIY